MPKKEKIPDTEKSTVEYYCSVFFSFNKLKKQQEYCIRLETAKLFSTFNYKLTLINERKKNNINIKIKGLTPDHTYLSEVKPAICDIYLEELYGDYIINVIKQDGALNSAGFNFNIFNKQIRLLESNLNMNENVRQFCTFHTADDLNTFS